MNGTAFKNRSVRNFLLLLFALSAPLWVLGSIHDVQLFPGFKLYQFGLGMPAVAALVFTFREGAASGELSRKQEEARAKLEALFKKKTS